MNKSSEYKPLENTIIDIYKKYIALPKEAKVINNKLLETVLQYFVKKMQEKDPLFKSLYGKLYFGGSYYDGTKISHPNEYDIDLLFCISKNSDVIVKGSERPGFVYVTYKSQDVEVMKMMDKLVDSENYLSTEKVYKWLESVIQRCINDLSKRDGNQYIEFKYMEKTMFANVKLYKGKPAFTLKLNIESQPEISVDLVGCFHFNQTYWPSVKDGYRKNPVPKKTDFFIVPKSPKNITSKNMDRYWRLSFQEQEKDIMTGNNFKSLKPALKVIKKIRDKYNHPVASYFIKTVFLWTIEEKSGEKKFWDQSLIIVFMEMLKIYTKYMLDKNIPYYWNKKFNLLETVQNAEQIGNTLKNMIDKIDRNLNGEDILENYILSKEEFEKRRVQNLEKNASIDSSDAVDMPVTDLGLISSTDTNLQHNNNRMDQLGQLNLDEKQIMDQTQSIDMLKILERIENKIDQLTIKVAKLESDTENIKHSLQSMHGKDRITAIFFPEN